MDDRALFERVHGLLIAVATAARDAACEKKTNYRDFYVGSAVLARHETDDGLFVVLAGYNYMARKADPDKRCAEKHAIDEAVRCGYTRIIAIVVVGEPQPDDESSFSDGTLHPCGTCRRMFERHEAVSPDTFVLTVSCDDHNRLELWTVSQLITTHFLCGRSDLPN